jgi:hypothetical protein
LEDETRAKMILKKAYQGKIAAITIQAEMMYKSPMIRCVVFTLSELGCDLPLELLTAGYG